MSRFHAFASAALGKLTEVRNHFYDNKWFSVRQVNLPVISVGNLTVGGTGKTPVTQALARHLLLQNKKVGIISRNYKANFNGITKVNPADTEAISKSGDEPVLLAQSLPAVSVFSGPKKSETAVFATEQQPDLQVLLVDDGFQHRALHRDFDIVLIDATDVLTFEPLPLGRGREARSALARADWILITKSNWVDPLQVEWMRSLLPDNIPVSEVSFHLRTHSQGKNVVGAFAGIARPEIFFEQIKMEHPEVQKTWGFPDHHSFTTVELGELNLFLDGCAGESFLITTKKDAVRIKDEKLLQRLLVADLEVELEGRFLEKIDSVVS